MLYGVGEGGPLCVSQGNSALKNCAAQGDAKKAAKFVVDNKLQNEAKNSASAIQKNVCGGGAVENPLVAERRRVFSVSCPQVTAQQATLNREIASLGPATQAPASKPQAAAPKPPPPMPAAMPPPAMPQAQAPAAPPPVPQPPKDPNVPAPPNVPRTGQLPSDEVPKKMEAGCENCETEVPSTASKPVQQTVQERKKILQQVCSQFKTTAKVHDNFPAANISVGLSSLLSFASGGEAQARADAKKPVTALVEQAHAVLLKEKEVKTGCPDGCSRVNEPELVMDNKPKARSKPVEGCPATIVNAFQKPANSGGRGDKPVTQQEVRAYDKQASLSGGIISKSFKGKGGECAKANESWAEGLLAKDSKLGEWAEEELCPGQCSFSSLVTTVDRSSGDSCDLTVRIDLRCGPPKAAREWVSTAKVVAKWRCEAK
jgi:hypothetical protein